MVPKNIYKFVVLFDGVAVGFNVDVISVDGDVVNVNVGKILVSYDGDLVIQLLVQNRAVG